MYLDLLVARFRSGPELVKICVNSIRKNAGDHKVIILTEDNYKDYVDMPSWVEEKREKGIISRTHYSDILKIDVISKVWWCMVRFYFFLYK